MKTIEAEVAVIGAGTAGMGAWRAARDHAREVVLIESGPYGTTCARVGCMPSKLLIAAADAAHAVAHADRFGVHAGPVRIDGEAVMRRVRGGRGSDGAGRACCWTGATGDGGTGDPGGNCGELTVPG